MPDAGLFLRVMRERHGLTQSELAERAFTRQSAISRIESGQISPTVRSLAALVEAMGERLILASSHA